MSEQVVITVNDDNFAGEVLKSDKPVLVDFWAPWCGPCKSLGPIVEEIAVELQGSVKIVKLNIDDSQKTALTYNVRSIPTLILFKDGKILDTLIGLVPKERLEAFVKKGI